MSALLQLHPSPESLRRAIERLSMPGAGEPDHNVGACCGRSASGGACACKGLVGPGGSPGAAMAMRTLGQIFGPALRDVLARLKESNLIGTNLSLDGIADALMSRTPEGGDPYADQIRDCMCMDTLVSAETVVGAAGTVTLSTSAGQGWFWSYYVDIQVRRPSATPLTEPSTCVEACTYTMTQPTVDGCPAPPCQPGGNIQRNAAFYLRRDTDSGCGRPFNGVIPSTQQGAPIVTTLAQLIPGDIAQIQFRGFCFDTRICC